MSCFKRRTQEDVENEKISKNIEQQIKDDRKKESNQIKLLLLGAPHFLWTEAFSFAPRESSLVSTRASHVFTTPIILSI